MSVRRMSLPFVLVASIAIVMIVVAACSAPPPPPPAQDAQVQGTLIQVMRGILFPASNVIFAAQGTDPATIKPADDPSTSTDPLSSSYGGWTAVENAGIALAEAANLLTIPGRVCSNGRPVPMQNADWQMWVKGLRDAGMASYKAAQSKSMDAMLDAAGVMSTACSNCHDKYREVQTRC
jgi:hypothetical protein